MRFARSALPLGVVHPCAFDPSFSPQLYQHPDAFSECRAFQYLGSLAKRLQDIELLPADTLPCSLYWFSYLVPTYKIVNVELFDLI